MAIFQRPIPRRAFLAAIFGALYALLILPPITPLSLVYAVAWLLLGIGLLFAKPLAYHAFTFFAILWVVYRGIDTFRAQKSVVIYVIDMVLPVGSLVLLMTSGYLDAVRAEE